MSHSQVQFLKAESWWTLWITFQVTHLMATAIPLQKIQAQISLHQSAEGLILLYFFGVFFCFSLLWDHKFFSSCALNNRVVGGISCSEIFRECPSMWWAWLHSNASGQATHACPVLSEVRHHGNLQWDLWGSKLRQSLENSFLEFKVLSSFKAPFGHWNKHSGPHLKCFVQGHLRGVQWILEMSPDLCLTLAIDPSIFIP